MRELVRLDLPFAAAVLGLLSVKSRTFVTPLVGMAIGMLAGLLAATMLLPEARFVLWPATNVAPGPAMQLFPRALPTSVLTLACIFADPVGGDLQPASDPFGGKEEFNLATEFVWNKFTDYVCPITRVAWTLNRRAIDLLPFDNESIMRSIIQPVPLDRDSARSVGESAIFCSVSRQLMNDHCHRLSGFCFQRYAGTADVSIAHTVRGNFTSNDFLQRYAIPVAPAQQFMCSGQ